MDTSGSLSLEMLRGLAQVNGFAWSDADLERLRPGVEAAWRQLAMLETLGLGATEPAVQYRVL